MVALPSVLEVVVVHLDAEDDDAAHGGDEVGNQQRPENLGLVEQSLQHEAETAHGHHQESWQRDTVGVACPNGLNGLWKVTQNQADAGYPSADFIY